MDAVLINDDGLEVLFGGNPVSVRYDMIERTLPLRNDGSETEIIAIRSDGKKFHIPILGRQGRFQDIFEFLRYLDRAILDTRSDRMN